MARAAVARRLNSMEMEQPGGKPFPKLVFSGREAPDELFAKALSAFREKGMGLRDMFSRMFRGAAPDDMEKISNCIERFSGPGQSAFAVNMIVVYEYTRSAECAVKIAERCLSMPGGDGERSYAVAVFASHMAKVVLNLARDGDEKRAAESVLLLLEALEHPVFSARGLRSLLMFSQASFRVYKATEFDCTVEAFRALADVAPDKISEFSEFIRDAGNMDTIICSEWGERVTKTTIDIVSDASMALVIAARYHPQELNRVLNAIRERNVANISQLADDMVYLVMTESI